MASRQEILSWPYVLSLLLRSRGEAAVMGRFGCENLDCDNNHYARKERFMNCDIFVDLGQELKEPKRLGFRQLEHCSF